MIPSRCQVARFTACGSVEEVVRVVDEALPAPAAGEVLLRLRYAPINPADINLIEGAYGIKPSLPAVGGLEGVGEVVALGHGATGFAIGDLARPIDGVGSWRSWACAPAAKLHRLPRLSDLQQAAMLGVNPATAWLLLHTLGEARPGEWVVQNAGNSGVGRCLIQLARARGLRTASLVRRPELIPELQALGGDAVVLDRREAAGELAAIWGKAAPRIALNQVGGDSALLLAKALAQGGTVATIGAMSREPIKLPAGLLIFKDLRFIGLWVTRWYQQAAPAERDAMLAGLGALVESKALVQPVAAVYPLARIAEAVAHARREARGGKILLDCQA